MAKALTQSKVIDSLPVHLRSKVLDMLMEDVASRKIAAFMTEYGYKISHNAIAEYKRDDLPKHIETANKLQRLQQVEGELNQPNVSLTEITNAALAADPFILHINRKRERLDRVMGKAEESADYKAVASLDRADTAVLTLHAQLAGRLQQAGPVTNVNIAFHATPAETPANLPYIDADVVDLSPGIKK